MRLQGLGGECVCVCMRVCVYVCVGVGVCGLFVGWMAEVGVVEARMFRGGGYAFGLNQNESFI